MTLDAENITHKEATLNFPLNSSDTNSAQFAVTFHTFIYFFTGIKIRVSFNRNLSNSSVFLYYFSSHEQLQKK
jgi:hypothetical protein